VLQITRKRKGFSLVGAVMLQGGTPLQVKAQVAADAELLKSVKELVANWFEASKPKPPTPSANAADDEKAEDTPPNKTTSPSENSQKVSKDPPPTVPVENKPSENTVTAEPDKPEASPTEPEAPPAEPEAPPVEPEAPPVEPE
jgi:hypothetical protein